MRIPDEKEVLSKMKELEAKAGAVAFEDKTFLKIAAYEEVERKRRADARLRHWLYALAFTFPPIGIVVALVFLFSKKPGRKSAGWMTAGVSVAGGVLLWASFAWMESQIPPSLMKELGPAIMSGDIQKLENLELQDYGGKGGANGSSSYEQEIENLLK